MTLGVGTIMTFADPSVGTDFSTTVPVGQAWRVWGGSCHIAASATVTNRTPTLYFKNGNNYIYVASNGLDYNHDANQTVVFYQQYAMQEGSVYNATAGQVWNITNNPSGLCLNPVGIRAIWLPTGTVIRYYMFNMQAGDQMSQVGMLVETAAV